MKIYTATILTLLISLNYSAIKAQLAPATETALQDILDNNSTSMGLAGVTCTVIAPNDCVWSGVSGLAGPSDPADLTRWWHWGSVGKSMTAYMILDLHEAGDIDINNAIGSYINVDTIPYLDSSLTVKMFLNHTTDQTNAWFNGSVLWDDVWNDRDSIWNMRATLSSSYRLAETPNPSLEHNYVGMDNYMVLGILIEEITGQDLGTAMQNRILSPLNLNNSGHVYNGFDMTMLNGVYDGTDYRGNLPHDSYLTTRGGGGIYVGTSHDVALYMRAFHNDQLLSISTMNEVRSKTNGAPTSVPGTCLGTLNQYYGLGTNVVDLVVSPGDTVKVYGHGGNGLGNSLVFHSIEDNITIALTTNDFSSNAGQANFALFMQLMCYLWDVSTDLNCFVSTEDIESNLFSVFPNPSNGQFTLEMSHLGENATIEIVNTSGAVVLRDEVSSGYNFELESAGLYFVSIRHDHSTETLKLVVTE